LGAALCQQETLDNAKKLLLELAKNSLTYKVIPPSTTNCAPVAKPDSFEAK
jgi:hypothetical protein